MTAVNERLQHALDVVTEARDEFFPAGRDADVARARKFDRYVAGLPAMLIANGLAQTCAVLTKDSSSDENNPLAGLRNGLAQWLQRSVYGGAPRDLVNLIMRGDQAQYALATHEAAQWSGWVKKFSGALLAPLIPADTPEESD